MIATFLSLVFLSAPAPGEELTLDWILDGRNLRPLSLPATLWLPDETLLLVDPRSSAGLERLDPRTLDRGPFAQGERILQSWRSLPGEGRAPERLGLPTEVSSDGKTFLYVEGRDLYLVSPTSGSVLRGTNTEAEEEVPRFSPDGRWLAYIRDRDLYVLLAQTGSERRLTRDGSPTLLNGTLSWVYWEEIQNRVDEAYWWAPDSSAILYLQSDESVVGEFPIPDWTPPEPRIRRQRYPKAGTTNPAVRVGIRELDGEGTRWLDLGAPPPEYVARAGWTARGDEVAVATLNRAQDRLELWLHERRSPERRRLLLTETSSTWVNLHDDMHFIDGALLWLSERDGFRRLWLEPLQESSPLLLSGTDVQLDPAGWPPRWRGAVASIDAAGGRFFFHGAPPRTFGRQLYGASLRGASLSAGGCPSGEVERLSEGDGTHRVVFSPGGRWYVDSYSRSSRPPQLTLHRADGALLHVIAPSNAEPLERFDLVEPRLFTVEADDGTPLPALLYAPADAATRPARHPAIVHVYGGPGSPVVRDSWGGFGHLWANLLLQRGFCVFSVDPRSSADWGKAGEDQVFRRFYGEVELRDILAGVRHLKKLPFVDPARVGIWGWSGGGSTTLYAMTHSDEFRAGIAVAGVTDYRYYDTVYAERYMRRPEENADGYRGSAVVGSAGDLHGRLLLVHGLADDNVHAQNAFRFADALIGAGKQFELMIYPGRGHGIGDPAARRHLYALMLSFWDRALRGDSGEEGAREF